MFDTLLQLIDTLQKQPLEALEAVFNGNVHESCSRYKKSLIQTV
jgi:hypothetical protein